MSVDADLFAAPLTLQTEFLFSASRFFHAISLTDGGRVGWSRRFLSEVRRNKKDRLPAGFYLKLTLALDVSSGNKV